MENLNLRLHGIRREMYIKRLREVAGVSSRMHINMLKDIIRLPLIPFIDMIFEWVNQYEYAILDTYINLESESLEKLIDILDKKFVEWKRIEQHSMKYDSVNKIENSISVFDESREQKSNMGEELKFKLLQMLGEFGDKDAIKILKTFKEIVHNLESKEKFINDFNHLIKDSNLDKTISTENFFNILSNSITLMNFMSLLDNIWGTHFSKSKILISDNGGTSLKKSFSRSTGILPEKIIWLPYSKDSYKNPTRKNITPNRYFIFVKRKDYEYAKMLVKKPTKRLLGREGRFFILRIPKSIVELITNIVENVLDIDILAIKTEWNYTKGGRELIVIIGSRGNVKVDVNLCKNIESLFESYINLDEWFVPITIKIQINNL